MVRLLDDRMSSMCDKYAMIQQWERRIFTPDLFGGCIKCNINKSTDQSWMNDLFILQMVSNITHYYYDLLAWQHDKMRKICLYALWYDCFHLFPEQLQCIWNNYLIKHLQTYYYNYHRHTMLRFWTSTRRQKY